MSVYPLAVVLLVLFASTYNTNAVMDCSKYKELSKFAALYDVYKMAGYNTNSLLDPLNSSGSEVNKVRCLLKYCEEMENMENIGRYECSLRIAAATLERKKQSIPV